MSLWLRDVSCDGRLVEECSLHGDRRQALAGIGHDQTLSLGMGFCDVGRKVAAVPNDRLFEPTSTSGLYAAGARGR
ncbi:MAG: hypothetical protein OXG79_08915 [Chloroflexi bacterium]|nr:hypothetical protein [Chloroflexota bacterium]